MFLVQGPTTNVTISIPASKGFYKIFPCRGFKALQVHFSSHPVVLFSFIIQFASTLIRLGRRKKYGWVIQLVKDQVCWLA